MDCVHIPWCCTPMSRKNIHTGRSNNTTRTYEVCVNHARLILHATPGFPGFVFVELIHSSSIVKSIFIHFGHIDSCYTVQARQPTRISLGWMRSFVPYGRTHCTLKHSLSFTPPLTPTTPPSRSTAVSTSLPIMGAVHRSARVRCAGMLTCPCARARSFAHAFRYHEWRIFQCPIKHPLSRTQFVFSKRLESVRKDVEDTFGMLKVRPSLQLTVPCMRTSACPQPTASEVTGSIPLSHSTPVSLSL